MSDKQKPADQSGTERSSNREGPLREGVNPTRGGTADFGTPPSHPNNVSERNPVPTEPPKRK